MPCLMSGVMLRRSARYFCRSPSISGSVRHSWPCCFQYAFHASRSFVAGRCKVDAWLPSCSLIVLPLRSTLILHTVHRSLSKESLGQCSYKGNFNEQSHKGFNGGNKCLWVAWVELFRKEPTSMKRGHADDNCLIPSKM